MEWDLLELQLFSETPASQEFSEQLYREEVHGEKVGRVGAEQPLN